MLLHILYSTVHAPSQYSSMCTPFSSPVTSPPFPPSLSCSASEALHHKRESPASPPPPCSQHLARSVSAKDCVATLRYGRAHVLRLKRGKKAQLVEQIGEQHRLCRLRKGSTWTVLQLAGTGVSMSCTPESSLEALATAVRTGAVLTRVPSTKTVESDRRDKWAATASPGTKPRRSPGVHDGPVSVLLTLFTATLYCQLYEAEVLERGALHVQSSHSTIPKLYTSTFRWYGLCSITWAHVTSSQVTRHKSQVAMH